MEIALYKYLFIIIIFLYPLTSLLGYPLAYKQFTDVTTSTLMAFTSTGKKWARNGEFIRRD